MAKGAVAKQNVINELRKVFGDKYIGEHDKKIYVWADDGGELVQIAIALTCPKNMIEVGAMPTTDPAAASIGGDFNWDDTPVSTVKIKEITPDELDNIKNLMEKLGL